MLKHNSGSAVGWKLMLTVPSVQCVGLETSPRGLFSHPKQMRDYKHTSSSIKALALPTWCS